jgi:ubiquinone/menaquinone biosynthesis C-methylase UbiE
MNREKIISGDFTGLASDYSLSRPGYSQLVLKTIIGLLKAPFGELDVVDVGAGTGIWTRMIAEQIPRSLSAIEPNDEMRERGIHDSKMFQRQIKWRNGTGEATGLDSGSTDWITMASSFHWVRFDEGVREVSRVLKPGGWFTALWNPRVIETNPILVEIEQNLHDLQPNLIRKSSGRSGITADLSNRLHNCGYFDEIMYIESRHTLKMSVERYLSAWRSANDVQAQLGKEKFELFLNFVVSQLSSVSYVDAEYLTRSWSSRKTE